MNVLLARLSILSVCVFAIAATPAHAQSQTATSVPRIVRVTSTFHPADGRPPAAVETMTLSIYAEETGGVPLWQETQTVSVNPDGRFTAAPGIDATRGIAAGSVRLRRAAVARYPRRASREKVEPGRIRLLLLNGVTTSPAAANTADDAGAPLSWVKGDFKIQVFGAIRLDAMYNTARVQGPGLPAFLTPKFVGGFTESTIAMNARNSSVGVAFTGPDIGNFHSGGRLSAVFFDNTNVFADRNGFLLTSAYGELFNDKWRFAAGLQLDILAPLLPTVLTFSADGAPIGDSIKGQIRVERYLQLGSDSQVTLQGGISEPLNSASSPDINLDEDNGWPNVEGRVAFGVGKPAPIGIGLLTPRPLEVAVSGVVGQLRRTSLDPGRRVVSDVWGVAVDTQGNFNGVVGFKGEAYTGQGLGQMTGGILQSLDAVTWKAIGSTGGWVEGFVYLKPNLHSHTGMFIDDVNDEDLTAIPGASSGGPTTALSGPMCSGM